MSAILFLVVAMATVSASEHDELFEAFRSRYKRDYHVRELGYRRSVYADNMNYINAHNARAADGEHTFTLRENQFTDMTNEEFRAFRAGADLARRELQQEGRDGELWKRGGREKRSGAARRRAIRDASGVDWRDEGYVTRVKNQGMCGAGWAFSAIGALEGQLFRRTGQLVNLSEQNLVDCDSYNGGCNGGGTVDGAYTYAISHGIATQSSYPYKGKDGTCESGSATIVVNPTSYVNILTGDEDALRRAVVENGPVAASIDASTTSFQFYSGGVHYYAGCSSSSARLNHAVLIVGYGNDSDENQDYWIVKNSWGTSWGMNGYIHMARGRNNNCGVATDASYPVV